MKHALVVILVVFLLLVFSSCERHLSIEERYESLEEEYYSLEEKYFKESGRVEELENALCKIQDDCLTISGYLEDGDRSKSEVILALDDIWSILNKLGY